MPGTGKKGYTGASIYGGNYNIQNGIIQSGSGASSSAVASRNSPFGRSVDSSVPSQAARSIASSVAGVAGFDDSDYGDYVREALDIAANNTAQSQAFAREQMEYQRQSDATAMAWSAAEAQKNRDWQERLSDSAHQREVKDLIAAGLNPILSANQGAHTGSGATGQAFSSSGAMGSVDTSASGLIGQLASAYINTASQAAIAGMYTDATRYQADMQYAQSKMNVDANMLMHDKSISSNEKINALNSDTAIRNANTTAAASLGSANVMAGANVQASLNNMIASLYSSDKHLEGTQYASDRSYSSSIYNTNMNRENVRTQENTKYNLSPYYTGKSTAGRVAKNFENAWKQTLGREVKLPSFSDLTNGKWRKW